MAKSKKTVDAGRAKLRAIEKVVSKALAKGRDPTLICLSPTEANISREEIVSWMEGMFDYRPRSNALQAVSLTLAREWAAAK